MADEPNKSASWWSTLPGILAATAAVITAVTGLVAILSQTGVFGEKSKTFVGQKAGDIRDAVAPASPAKAPAEGAPAAARVADARVAPPPDPASGSSGSGSSSSGNASGGGGIASTPLRAVPFTGALVTLNDGTSVRLRGAVRDMCQPTPILKTLGGQSIDMERMRRFELSDWNVNDRRGNARIVLNNGETMDVRVDGCAIIGTNDLGDFRGGFETIRSVEFVR